MRKNFRTIDNTGRRSVIRTLGATTVAGLAGCVGGTGDSDSILVGNLSPFSGTFDWIGPQAERAIQTALEGEGGINQSTINGRTVEIATADTETDPGAAIDAFNELDQQGVETMVGPSSAVTPSLYRPALTARLSFVSCMSGTIQLDNIGGEYIWRTVPSDSVGARAQAQYAYEVGGHRQLILAYKNRKDPYSFAQAAGDYFESLGGTVVREIVLDPDAESYTTEAETVQESEATAVSLTGDANVTDQFIRAATDSGVNFLLPPDVTTPGFIETVGPDRMEGVVGLTTASGPAYEAFAEQHRTIHETDPGTFASAAYDAMNLIALAFVKEGDANRDAVPNHLRDIGNPPGTQVSTFAEGKRVLNEGGSVDYVGAATPQNFNEYGDPLGPLSMRKVTDGQWENVQRYAASDLL